MRKNSFFLGMAGGFLAGYAAYRAYECAAVAREGPQPKTRDAAAYGRLRRKLSVAAIARSIAATFLVASGDLGGAMDRRTQSLPVWLRPAVFAGVVTLLDAIVELPADYVESHVVEQRFALTEQSARSWAADRAKAHALGTAVSAIIAVLLAAALRRWPRTWAAIAWAGAFPLLAFANIVVPIYVMPLFNKYEPLEGPLERRLRALAARFGVGDAQILRVDMSRQTKKANAFVIGIGSTHRIVVGDTLIEHFPDEEIEFVVAHELGHYVSRDTWRMMAVAQTAIAAILFGSSVALGRSDNGSTLGALARLQLWATLLTQALRPAICAFARSREWAADRFALSATGTPQAGAAAFRRLRDQNLAEDEQPPWYEFFFSTHPSLRARIDVLTR